MIAITTILISACSLPTEHKVWKHESPEQFVVLSAVGYAPISAQQGQSDQHKTLQAMQASKLDAYRELSERVYGQEISAQSSVADMVLGQTQLQSSVSGVIRGARVKRSYALDDTYITELELDFAEIYQVIASQVTPRTEQIDSTIAF
ncbi:flagellar biosynthesis protein FlgP [Alginatibacterium sediminis]|uniref:Flagellar biosynthesis protein FlgP n=2 Tax=Alginatibacterium sediminis TaxID=2164068 RepID=A0A420EIE2_9ALTE|nr:flagellar biosynthesis protein FlgP [Alginatibacterium sediminis]